MSAEKKIDPLSAEAHNQWVDETLEDIEFEPLREFLERLKEPISVDIPAESATK